MMENKLFLVCGICNPDGWLDTDDVIQIAKYRPSTGWFIPFILQGEYLTLLNRWFERHIHDKYPAPDPNYFMKSPEPGQDKKSGPYMLASEHHIKLEYDIKETARNGKDKEEVRDSNGTEDRRVSSG